MVSAVANFIFFAKAMDIFREYCFKIKFRYLQAEQETKTTLKVEMYAVVCDI